MPRPVEAGDRSPTPVSKGSIPLRGSNKRTHHETRRYPQRKNQHKRKIQIL